MRLTSVLTPFGNQSKNAVWQSATVGIGNDENETREYDLFELYHRKRGMKKGVNPKPAKTYWD